MESLKLRIFYVIPGLVFLLGACASNPKNGQLNGERLMFRDGPVCMCSTGQSEKDIQEGQKRQLEAAD